MAYNSWNNSYYPAINPYPQNYPQNYAQGYPQNYPQAPQSQPAQQVQVTPQQQQTIPIQNGGFISVPNIEVARNWAVAPGNSVTFKDESAPYIYTKTMSYNQLDTPRFERFKLVKEEDVSQALYNAPNNALNNEAIDLSAYALKTDLAALQSELDAIRDKIQSQAPKEKTAAKAKGDAE